MIDKPKMEYNIIGIEDLDTPIYRIFSLDRFSEMITSGENGLVHPSKWDDPFENFFLKCDAETPEGETVSLSSLSASWYGQCWTLNSDSDAMWRIYSKDKKEGVKVKTTVRKLFTDFYNLTDNHARLKYLVGAVEYKPKIEIENLL